MLAGVFQKYYFIFDNSFINFLGVLVKEFDKKFHQEILEEKNVGPNKFGMMDVIMLY
jgi:hypothetical protein